MKKLISLILAFAMVFSLAMPAFAADTNTTLYFKNTAGWSTVYAYYWSDSNTGMVTWPGTVMTLVNGETDVYTIEVPSEAAYIIFNNGGGSQTDDLIIPTDGKNLYNYGTETWSTYDSAGDTSDQTKGDVTASYTPTITISGVTIGEAAIDPGAVAVDETNKTYTVTIPADQTFVDVTVTVSGQNLDKIAADDYSYIVLFADLMCLIKSGDYDSNTGKVVMSYTLETYEIGTYDLMYTTNGGTNWFDTEWDIVVKQAEAEATEVSFDVMLKGVDSSGTEITGDITGYWNSTVVDNVTPSSKLFKPGDYTLSGWIVPSGYQTPAEVSVTVTDDGNGNGVLTSNSSHASISTITTDGDETVYVITVTLEAETTEVSEAKWGASKDSLTGSGTLAEAIAAAEADSTVKYIQLQSDVTAESSFLITSGEFTIDLNGQTVTCSDDYTFVVRNSGTKVTFADSGTTGVVTSESTDAAAIILLSSGEVLITGGSYSGDYALQIDSDSSAAITGGTFTSTNSYAINNSGTLTISGGTIGSGSWANVAVSGTTTITGGTFTGSGTDGNFSYYSGTLDLSGYSDVTGLKVSQWTEGDLTVSDTTIKLPDGYTFVDDSNNPVTTLTSGTVYTIAAEAVKYTVTVNAATNGTVTADKATAAEDDTVTLTWTTEGIYELDNIVVTDAGGNEVTITDKGLTAWTFTMPASNVTVTATFKKIATTSANIVWGSMAFTYTDGENGAKGAWSNDGSEKAGTVTVTNTGTTAITATPSYAAATDEYGTFTGSFDVASADLDAGVSKTFTLSLSGDPTKAIPAGTKIGTVTITIK